MNIKSYLRGIGAGMIVTALVMGVSKGGHKMTEAEIIAAAKSLGMVESSTLLAMNENANAETETTVSSIPVKETTSIDKKEDSVGEETAVSYDKSEEVEDTKATEDEALEAEDTVTSIDSSDKVQDTNNETEDEPKEDNQITPATINPMPDGEAGFVSGEEYVEIKVIRGDSSVSVSRRIFEAGLVESAVEFDRYLCQNGYDKSISVGEYKLSYGSDFEEIAKTITRRK